MNYFPGFLKLEGRDVLVVGGGDIALRKARLLQAAGARITVVAPETNPAFAEFIASHELELRHRRFFDHDIEGFWLVVTATGITAIDRRVFVAASRLQVFCNSDDDQDNSSYITPAIVDRNPVVVALGAVPAEVVDEETIPVPAQTAAICAKQAF